MARRSAPGCAGDEEAGLEDQDQEGLSRAEELKRGSIEIVALPMISGQANQSWSTSIRPYNDVIKDIGGVTTDTQRIVY